MQSFFIMFWLVIGIVEGQTRVGFYSDTCPQAEAIVKATVEHHFRLNSDIAPDLLRMHFHDCFVRGCDAPVLISGPDTERTGAPNLTLEGFEVIDDAKTKLERCCPGVVSCADILALAARDSVVLTNGPTWPVPTGRRDGRVSLASETNRIPTFTDPVDSHRLQFLALGLNDRDLVALVGAHTIGTASCQVFDYRLYDFTPSATGVDPSLDPEFALWLQALCPRNGNGTTRVPLDTGSVGCFDLLYFENLENGRGILESDQNMWTNPYTRKIVRSYLNVSGRSSLSFQDDFVKAMIKMSNIDVKTYVDGEIRKNCSVVN